MVKLKKLKILILIVLITLFGNSAFGQLVMDDNNDLNFGVPIGAGSDSPDYDLCPEGAGVVAAFLEAWSNKNYKRMYELLDEDSKKDHSFQDAKFDFQMMEYKPYKISIIRAAGENYEFILGYGEWQYGDKETKKMIISGKTKRIIMQPGNSPFKRSVEDYI